MELSCHFLKAYNIDQIHFGLIRALFQKGNVYVIDRGSFEGHKRLEFDHVTFQITNPGHRPLTPILPQGVPPVTSEGDIINYCAKYLMSSEVTENENYTYGQYIVQQLPALIDMYKKDGHGTNQATLAVGEPKSISQEYPPCLRLIDTRIKDGRLHFIVYFRSWDLWGGLPENLGGLQILKEYLAAEIGCEDGELIASSKGLHLYDIAWPVALARLAGVMPEDSVITKEEAKLGEGWMTKQEGTG